MRRAIARGRVFPQSYSTDRRYGRLSLKACALFPLMWANADDQGRLCGDPEEIKYAACPNIDHIAKADIPVILEELQNNKLIKVYTAPKSPAIQLLDWWDVQKPQWAWPSEYPPPDGWLDRLRYKRGAREVVTINWNVSPEGQNGSQVSTALLSGEFSREQSQKGFSHSPKEKEREEERGIRKRRGNSPEDSGENPSPSLTSTSLFNNLVDTYNRGWGKMPDSRETAQLRDLSKELSSAGGATAEQVYDAFKEAATHEKYHISYVRAVLFDWLGLERGPP